MITMFAKQNHASMATLFDFAIIIDLLQPSLVCSFE